jgi:branched-chain amino acid transport system permease protein
LIGSILVVPAAILTAATSGLNPAMGHHIMLISIAATIVGGVGSLRGAAVAGMLLGLAENLCLAFIDPQWSEAVTFVILFLFILFRPGGVYGRAVVS